MSPLQSHASVHEELERLVHESRRLREEHRRARPGSHTRRHLGSQLERLTARFERLLRAADLDAHDERRWRDHLRHGAAEPEGPAELAQLVFRGRSDSGSELRLLARRDGTLDALVDGASVARLDRARELAATTTGLTFRLEGNAFAETFLVSPIALDALRKSLEGGAPLDTAAIGELFADGIVDRDRNVTPRGRRVLGLDASSARPVSRRAGGLSVSIRGPLRTSARVELEEMLDRVAVVAPSPPLRARASLAKEEDRALERPVIGKAQLEFPGRTIRAHVASATAAEAVGLLEDRLRRNLLDLRERSEAARTEGRPAEPGEWRHTDFAVARPAFFDRPPEQRQLVRRKSYSAGPLSADEASSEMRLLDHDFHLFVDATSGEDALVYVREDDVLGLKRTRGDGGWVEPFRLDPEPAPTLDVEQAIERLNTTQERFLFFIEADSGRGAVLYRRYDGHYGLVTLS